VSELHKFLFDGLPVRGAIVRVTDAWQEMLRRRAANTETGAYPLPVQTLLGEMVAAGLLMQSNIKFEGALILQIAGDGPLKLAVAEVHSSLAVRSTATLGSAARASVQDDTPLSALLNQQGQGRCAITLDPDRKLPGQQPYQGIVPLVNEAGEPLESLNVILQQYMRQSEQLDTVLVLAANAQVAAGLLVQRMPVKGQDNLAAGQLDTEAEDTLGENEDFNRIAHLASSLQKDELLTLDVPTILRRLFWQEPLVQLPAAVDAAGAALRPHFRCTCSKERVENMLRNLGEAESQGIVAEQGRIQVGCEFCGQQYLFDPVDVTALFSGDATHSPQASRTMH
jgi:molecular chaperone Hsp33